MIDRENDYYARKASPIRDEFDDLDLEDRLSDYDDPYQPPQHPPPSAHATGTLIYSLNLKSSRVTDLTDFRRSEEGGPAASPRVSQQASDEEELPAPSAAHDASGEQGSRALLGISATVFSPQVGGNKMVCYFLQ